VTRPKWDSPEVLRVRNLRLIAERTGWPAGAAEACEEMEAKFPDWWVCWSPENTCPGFEDPTGFYATFEGHHRSERRRLYAATADELLALLSREP
jgi:hypothetical protein